MHEFRLVVLSTERVLDVREHIKEFAWAFTKGSHAADDPVEQNPEKLNFLLS
jgi:hypothetical protein